jgi:triacylglycerol esterase/lipase EstA (alpha/beta hydrolase family)
LVKDEILKKEAQSLSTEIQGKIKNLQSYIDFVKGMKTAYLKNGKLKKGYQLAVTDHEEKIQLLKNQ